MVAGEQFRYGPFLVNRGGLITLVAPEAVISFAWQMAQASCLLRPDCVRVRMVLGRVPSSATSGGRRGMCLTMLDLVPALLPRTLRLLVLADHRVVIESALPVSLPASAVGLLTALVSWVLAAAPFQELMLAEGLEPLRGG